MTFTAIHEVKNVQLALDGETRQAYYRNSYGYLWDRTTFTSLKSLIVNMDGRLPHTISFETPSLWCWGCYVTGVPARLFELPIRARVTAVRRVNGKPVESTLVVDQDVYPTSLPTADDTAFWADGQNASLRRIEDFPAGNFSNWPAKYTINPVISSTNGPHDKGVSFNTIVLTEQDIQQQISYTYNILIVARPVNTGGMLKYYEAYGLYSLDPYTGTFSGNITTWPNTTGQDSQQVLFETSLTVGDLSSDATGGAFLMKGRKYNAYDLLRRALLTVDTQLINNTVQGLDELDNNGNEQQSIEYPIIVDPIWRSRMQIATIYETIFENKNLWEVLLQIGYYLHAIPYLEFAKDGTDRFVLKFRQLGDTRQNPDTNTKITVFNSRNLSDYFSQYDSYVTNLFSPQNIVEEWITVKTGDSSYLVSNDTAELNTSKPILEVVEFDCIYDGHAGGTAGTKSILTYIFENSIYQILTSDDPEKIRPAKGNALYYTFGTNKIQGLQYLPPQVSSGTFSYALQQIVTREFGAGSNPINIPKNIKYNNLRFRIKYRTQDSLRLSQVRPDITRFVKNSEYEKYPHHEQFYGQQDKIVDSERLSANLFGKLVRVGNAIAQSQEYVSAGDEKETGDLVLIDVGNGKEPYYVTSIEGEYYAEVVLQKVSYSKNFNQLSQIVTIPSEPRFHEVSERSKIRREVRIMEFLELSTVAPPAPQSLRFMEGTTLQNLLKTVVFAKENTFTHPNFAYSKFKADKKRQHKGSYGQFVDSEVLFPSSDIDRSNPNNITPLHPKSYADNITTVLHFPLHDGIVYEWDMVDNFSAGDFIDTEIKSPDNAPNKNAAYYAQQPVRYVDILGRADLFEFKLINKTSWTKTEVQSMPKALNVPADNIAQFKTPTNLSIALDKDNREELSFNYQINLVHSADRNIDDFLTFPNLFGEKDSDLRMCLLNQRQSMFNENIDLSGALIVADNVQYSLNNITNALELTITPPTNL